MYTKGPWKALETHDEHTMEIYSPTTRTLVAAVCDVTGQPMKANAHRICTCVNGWDDLEAERDSALSQFRIHEEASLKLWAENKALLEACKEALIELEPSAMNSTPVDIVVSKLQAAILKAENK